MAEKGEPKEGTYLGGCEAADEIIDRLDALGLEDKAVILQYLGDTYVVNEDGVPCRYCERCQKLVVSCAGGRCDYCKTSLCGDCAAEARITIDICWRCPRVFCDECVPDPWMIGEGFRVCSLECAQPENYVDEDDEADDAAADAETEEGDAD